MSSFLRAIVESRQAQETDGTVNGSDIGVPQLFETKYGHKKHDIEFKIQQSRNYMRKVVKEKLGEEYFEICAIINSFSKPG